MYSPEIKPDLVAKLYYIGKQKKKPMTQVVDEILRPVVAKMEKKLNTDITTNKEYNNG